MIMIYNESILGYVKCDASHTGMSVGSKMVVDALIEDIKKQLERGRFIDNCPKVTSMPKDSFLESLNKR